MESNEALIEAIKANTEAQAEVLEELRAMTLVFGELASSDFREQVRNLPESIRDAILEITNM